MADGGIKPEQAATGLGILLAGVYSAWRWIGGGKRHAENVEHLNNLATEVRQLHLCLDEQGRHIAGLLASQELEQVRLARIENSIDRLDGRIDDAIMARKR